MSEKPHPWHHWAQTLQPWGGCNLVATMLEAAGPLTVLGAQVVYVGQPILKQIISLSTLDAVAEMLEDPQQVQAFSAYLRQCA